MATVKLCVPHMNSHPGCARRCHGIRSSAAWCLCHISMRTGAAWHFIPCRGQMQKCRNSTMTHLHGPGCSCFQLHQLAPFAICACGMLLVHNLQLLVVHQGRYDATLVLLLCLLLQLFNLQLLHQEPDVRHADMMFAARTWNARQSWHSMCVTFMGLLSSSVVVMHCNWFFLPRVA